MPGLAYDRAAAGYDATRGYLPGVAERIRDRLLAATGSDHRTRFLDLGVGTGRIAWPFVIAGYNYTGIDLSWPMLEQFRRKLAANPTFGQSAPLVQGDVCRLPFAPGMFDVLIMVNVLHLVDDRQSALREAQRVLRRGSGSLVIARDTRQEVPPNGVAAPSRLVATEWARILADLGADPPPQPGRPWADLYLSVVMALEEGGARVEELPPLEYALPAQSPRDLIAQLRLRAYPEQWTLPDAVYAEALRRIEHWLDRTCSGPDIASPRLGRFAAMVVTETA